MKHGVRSKIAAYWLPAALVAFLAPLACAETQTDWSGGPGTTGPTVEWGNNYAQSQGLSWRSVSGQLALSAAPVAAATQHIVAGDAGMPHSVGVGDFNGDGRLDIVNSDAVYDVFAQLGAVYVWLQRDGEQWQRVPVDTNFYGAFNVNTADVDGDGDQDVIATAYYGKRNLDEDRNGRYAWFENLNGAGTAWQKHVIGEFFYGARYVDAADLDGDGDTDLLGASDLTQFFDTQQGDIVWFENLDGAGDSWVQHDLESDFDNGYNARAADVDSDGDMDVIGTQSGAIAWWENVNGDASAWNMHFVTQSLSNVAYIDSGDIDNDGDIDLLGGSFSAVQSLWWENLDGDGMQWSSHVVGGLFGGWAVEVEDLDGDGDLDGLYAVTDAAPSALWYENVGGDGSTWLLHTIEALVQGPTWVRAGDIDGDGKLDAILSDNDPFNSGIEQISWYDFTDFVSSGQLSSTILDGGTNADWGLLHWDALVPAGSQLTVEVRAGSDPLDLGNYTPLALTPVDLETVIDPLARYLQYRLTLAGAPSGASPIMRELTVNALVLQVPEPLLAGQLNTISVRWSTAGDRVRLAIAARPGETAVPGCAGLSLQLPPGSIRAQATTDAGGLAQFSINIPAALAGRRLHFQALQPGSCSASNKVEPAVVAPTAAAFRSSLR